jgi:hypothetical protein
MYDPHIAVDHEQHGRDCVYQMLQKTVVSLKIVHFKRCFSSFSYILTVIIIYFQFRAHSGGGQPVIVDPGKMTVREGAAGPRSGMILY